MDKFNLRFDKLVYDIPHDHQPTPTIVLLYYLNAFQGQFSFFLNQSKPTDLKDAKAKAKSLEVDWVFSRKLIF